MGSAGQVMMQSSTAGSGQTFFFALVVMGMVCGAVASALYIVDAHRKLIDMDRGSRLTISQGTYPSKVSPAS